MAKVVWSEKSILCLEKIADYISQDSIFYAKRTVKEIKSMVDKLEFFPNIGIFVREYEDQTIKQLIYKSYRIIYKIEENRVIVLTVVSGYREL